MKHSPLSLLHRLCCMGDRLGIPMNVVFFPLSFFFYQLSLFLSLLVHSLDLHPSSSYSFLIAFFAFKSTCFRPSLCLFPLSLSLLTSACFPRCFCRCLSWGLSAGLSCAVICHTTEGKKHLLLMLPSCRSFFVSQCLRPFGFCPLHKCHLCCYWGRVFLCFLKSVFGCLQKKVQFSPLSDGCMTAIIIIIMMMMMMDPIRNKMLHHCYYYYSQIDLQK